MISSVANPTIRRVRRLRKRPWRQRLGLFLAEGHRAVRAASAAGALREAFYTPRAARLRPDLLAELGRAAGELHEVSEPVMAHLSSATTAPDLLGVAAMAEAPIGVLERGSPAVLLAGVRDPATAGAVLATSAAAGIPLAIVAEGSTDPFSPKVVRAAHGAHFVMRLVRAPDAGEAVARARAAGLRIVAVADGGTPPWEADLSGPILLWVDAPGAHSGEADARVSGPAGAVETPLAAQVGAVLSEWVRQGAR